MIGKLKGVIDSYGEDHVIIDVQGVGYVVQCSARTLQRLPKPGEAAALSIETHVREDAIRLYGFMSDVERDWFRLMQVVQGVGTKGGHEVLKFDPDGNPVAGSGEGFWVEGRSGAFILPEGVETVRASAAGPDGSMWIVADVNAGSATQPIKGQADVVLMKLDSAGHVVVSRALPVQVPVRTLTASMPSRKYRYNWRPSM